MNDYEQIQIKREAVSEDLNECEHYPDKLPQKRRRPLAVRIIIWVLIVALVFLTLYTLLVHPMDKLLISLALTRNCTISVDTYTSWLPTPVVRVDGDVISIQDKEFFEIKNNKLYTYSSLFRQKILIADLGPDSDMTTAIDKIISSGSGSVTDSLKSDLVKILNARNYKRVDFNLWELKDDVELEGFRCATFKRTWDGSFVLSLETNHFPITLTIHQIGRTQIDPPWE